MRSVQALLALAASFVAGAAAAAGPQAAGQYRDGALWAAQVEYRQPMFWRLGAVAFAGLGGVAPGISHLGDSTVLPAAGIGLRFAASKKYRVNMSLDAAWGKDSSAVYFYLGEAF